MHACIYKTSMLNDFKLEEQWDGVHNEYIANYELCRTSTYIVLN
jgi:hypothetical protein